MADAQRKSDSVWRPYRPTDEAPWNLKRVVYLHRRAGFSASWSTIQRDLQDGPGAAIDRLVKAPTNHEDAQQFFAMANTIGDAAVASGSPGRLKAWWLYRMMRSPDPLTERLTLMWHNHFATSNRKVQDAARMREQNEVLRRHARAPFGDLLRAAVKHPAMLAWLDADSNRQGHPNENLARESMELFTLGLGNYSEGDVREAARSLTGWTIRENRFAFREDRHDAGEKSVLGRSGKFTGDDLFQILLEQPATAHRLAWRICQTFMGEGVVDESALLQLAEGLRQHDLSVDWAIDTVLRSELFFSDRNIGNRVAGPVEYVVGGLRALELCGSPPSTLLVAEWVARMGQDLFYPPNVGGWTEGRSWLGAAPLIARANFAQALVDGDLWHPPRKPAIRGLCLRHGGDGELDEQVAWLEQLLWGDAPADVVTDIAAAARLSDDPLAAALVLIMSNPEHYLA